MFGNYFNEKCSLLHVGDTYIYYSNKYYYIIIRVRHHASRTTTHTFIQVLYLYNEIIHVFEMRYNIFWYVRRSI